MARRDGEADACTSRCEPPPHATRRKSAMAERDGQADVCTTRRKPQVSALLIVAPHKEAIGRRTVSAGASIAASHVEVECDVERGNRG